MSEPINVCAGVIIHDNKVFAARRKPHLHMGGFWELPGGKIDHGETPQQCLARELKEELDIEVVVHEFIAENTHCYNDNNREDSGENSGQTNSKKTVRLMAYRVSLVTHTMSLTDHDQIRWLSFNELHTVDWAPADIPLIDALLAQQSVIAFYQQHAASYAQETLTLDMREHYRHFLQHLPASAHILDLGCGSGRDSRYFLDNGYEVTALDGSAELAAQAEVLLGQKVLVKLFQDITFEQAFEGIWACASLLHCPRTQLPSVFNKVEQALRQQGVLYASFKWGEHESRDERGRFFSNFTVESLREILTMSTSLTVLRCWEEVKPLRNGEQRWVNLLAQRSAET